VKENMPVGGKVVSVKARSVMNILNNRKSWKKFFEFFANFFYDFNVEYLLMMFVRVNLNKIVNLKNAQKFGIWIIL
jgi:hypothetical protein